MLKFLSACMLFLCGAVIAHAEIQPEKAHAEVLTDHVGKQWFWVWGNRAPAQIDGRAFLFDDNGKQLMDS